MRLHSFPTRRSSDLHALAPTSGLALDHGFQTGLYALTGLLLLGAAIAFTLVRSAPSPARARDEEPVLLDQAA